MASPVLRQQSRNKIHTDYLRMKSENNKMPADPKPFKLVSAPHLHNTENQDPGRPETGRKAPARQCVSRLPVLAKSLPLHTPSDFTQSHCRWEDKPLAGKAKTRKPHPRSVPFSMSQHKSTRTITETLQPRTDLQSRADTHVLIKTQNLKAKTSKPPAWLKTNTDCTKGTQRCPEQMTSHLSRRAGPSNTSSKSLCQNGAVPPARPSVSTESLDDMNELSLKDLPHSSRKPRCDSSEAQSDKERNFKPDHAALLGILCNEGGSSKSLRSTTSQPKHYAAFPQRVPVMKGHEKTGATAGSGKSVPFSPDPGALRSILQNEGVKLPGPMGATPRSSVCPPGRSTSVYRAQRVPVPKNLTESNERSAVPAVTLKETPLKKWIPQRVPNTRNLPMSSVKWHLSTHKSPFMNTLHLRRHNPTDPQQEEVVQRLFHDQEDEQGTHVSDTDPDPQAQGSTNQTTEANVESNPDEEQERSSDEGQPFLQAVQRESVIFFSTGKNLVRAPVFEKQESSFTPGHKGISSVSAAAFQNNPVGSLLRDLTSQKSRAVNPAVALLRKRLPLLEEQHLDQEVATYIALSAPTASGFVPPRLRCGNPVAFIFHFDESTRFVPISSDVSSGPPSHGSPM